MADLEALVALVSTAPGLLGKRDLAVVNGLDQSLDGDDGALIPHGDGYFVVCGEAISPPFLLADPYGAGSAAVVTNISDVRAMGARPHGIVDMLVSPSHEHADQVLQGMRWAADKLGVPILGGHLTIGHAPALSASATGFTKAPLRASNARPDDILIAAFATDGRYMSDANDFFTALHDRDPEALKTDGEALITVAERGFAHAARDISMPGIAGSLLQFAEGANVGATLDLDAIPRPDGTPLERWLLTFPSFGFLLAARPEAAQHAIDVFTEHGLAAAACGSFDATRTLKLRQGDTTATAWDLTQQPLTGLSPSAGA
ncbi:AIR synthase related protein [Solirubrobacter soli]|uniref:AIR synthase related protein n=1 Tax=Solirubrobacter soli TaxID=363832 RepID=UPI0004185CE4|nr:AIR synthase related protein [Solirubrobacter soli]